eukprot:Opistho-1_new@58566
MSAVLCAASSARTMGRLGLPLRTHACVRTYMRGIHPRLYRVTVVNTDGSSNVMRLPRDIPVLRLVDDMRNSLPWTPGSDVVNRDDDFQRAYEQRYAHLKVQPMESNQLEKARLMLQARLVANKGKPAQAAASATDAQSRMRKALAMAGAASTAEEKARSKQVADQQKAEEA